MLKNCGYPFSFAPFITLCQGHTVEEQCFAALSCMDLYNMVHKSVLILCSLKKYRVMR